MKAKKQRAVDPAPPSTDPTLVGRLTAWLPEPPSGAMTLDRRTTIVFLVSIVLLVIFQYFGRPEAHRGAHEVFLRPVADAVLGQHAAMAPYAHWAVSSVVWRILIPIALIVFVFRESAADYGWRWRGTLRHVPLYATLYVLMVPLIIWAAMQPSFQAKYPFYKDAVSGGFSFWGYELLYGIQFAGVEFFFRGFLTFALFKRFGYNAILIMAIPYVMVHFNKPLPETLGALGAALILGSLALKARSCVPGIFLHWGVGLTMDFLAVAKVLGGIGPALRAVL